MRKIIICLCVVAGLGFTASEGFALESVPNNLHPTNLDILAPQNAVSIDTPEKVHEFLKKNYGFPPHTTPYAV